MDDLGTVAYDGIRNKMKSEKSRDRLWLIIVAILLCLLCLFFVVFSIINKQAHKAQLHSAYEALSTALIVELDSYYRDHGQYPKSLNELTEIEYSDGAIPDMLKDFKYVSNGNSCELSYYSDYYGKELKNYMVEGELK